MQRRKRVLFISHDASLSGAPVLLLHLLGLLKKNNTCNFIVVVKRGGHLESRFMEMAPTIVLKPENYLQGNALKKFRQVFTGKITLLKAFYYSYRADIVFSNTITNGRLLNLLKFLGKPVISYIHELKYAADFFDLHKDSSLTIADTNLFLYPSGAVSRFLTQAYGIDERRKQYLPYYFPVTENQSGNQKTESRLQFSERYHLQPDRLWVVGMGTVSFRKGIDYFLEVFQLIKAAQTKISFVWIGDYEDETVKSYVQGILKEINSPDILFTGPMPYKTTNLLPFDIFFLSSREDPYPLVVLEAAYLAIPSICFAGSGGIPEFIEDDGGWIIPDFSAVCTAEMIKRIEENRGTIIEKGKQAVKKVMARHSNAEMTIDKFSAAINKTHYT